VKLLHAIYVSFINKYPFASMKLHCRYATSVTGINSTHHAVSHPPTTIFVLEM